MDSIVLNLYYDFRFELVMPPDGQWGTIDDNGSWTGLVGVMHRKVCGYFTMDFKGLGNSYLMRYADYSIIWLLI